MWRALKGFLALWIIGPLGLLLLRLFQVTLTFEDTQHPFEDSGERADLDGGPYVLVFWHEYQLLLPILYAREICKSGRALWALASPHRDGRIIAFLLRGFGIKVVPGSSSRGGRGATRLLIDRVKEGSNLGISPDGPRGPRRVAKRGAAVVGSHSSDARLVPLGVAVSDCWRLKSWDRFLIPKPFARVTFFVGRPVDLFAVSKNERAEVVQATLDELYAKSDAYYSVDESSPSSVGV